MKFSCFTIVIYCCISCSVELGNGKVDTIVATQKTEALYSQEEKETDISRNSEIIGDLQFEVSCYSAVDFLMKTGRQINASDIEELKKESVVLLTIADTSHHKKIKNHPRLSFTDEELSNYLNNEILSDFSVIQGGNTFFPFGIQQEDIGSPFQNKINLLFFFDNIDFSKEFKIQYNDQLFNTGLIRIKPKNKSL